MIKLKELTAQLETRLNTRIISFESIDLEGIPEQYKAFKSDNYKYRFRFVLNTADYKRAEFKDGKEIRYINCEVSKTGNEVEGVDQTTISLDTSLEFLIPIINSSPELNDNLEILTAVDSLITETFSQNSYGIIVDEDGGTVYSYSTRYTLLSTGMRAQRVGVGDSITMTASLEYFFIPYGVNSANVHLVIDGDDVRYIKFGRNRQGVQENGISSTTENGECEVVNVGSTYSISFDLPAKTSIISSTTETNFPKALREFMDGDVGSSNTAHLVRITRPISYDIVNKQRIDKVYEKLMIFSDVGENYETVLNGSVTVSMVSAMYDKNAEGLTTLSEYAQANWSDN